MKLALLFALSTFLYSTSPEMVRGYDSNKKLSYKFEMNYGMMNGIFAKYDPATGNVVAEGNFKNNLRHGTWKIYKDTKLVAQREYKNGFEFEITYVPKEGQPAKPNVTKKANLKKNSRNFIEYSAIAEKDVMWTKRIWRTIDNNETNAFLFGNNKFFGHLFKQMHAGKIKMYSGADDEFKVELTKDSLKTILPEGGFEIVEWKLKEDWVYLNEKMIFEPRIVGICPVIKDKKSGKTTNLCWMYYPDMRESLAGFKVVKKDEPRIQHADDAFYFRYFSSTIYKESNVNNRQISDFATGQAAIAVSHMIEVDLVCVAHGFWVK